MIEETMEEKLWETVQVLAGENKLEQAVVVINSIASHAIGRYSGKPVNVEIKETSKKELNVDQISSMKELSRQVSLLIEERQYEKAREKALEYIDGIVSILASSPDEEKGLRRSYLKHFIHLGTKPKRFHVKLKNGHSIPGQSKGINIKSSPELLLRDGSYRTNYRSNISTVEESYTTSEVAEILHVSDQTIRRMCEAGKFPDASRTDGGHWRIPRKYFNVTIEQSKQIDRDIADIIRKSHEGGQVDEFDL